MSRTSRCFAETTFQLGGPSVLTAAERSLRLADLFSYTTTQTIAVPSFTTIVGEAAPVRFRADGKSEPSAHNLKGDSAAQFAAI
jgi:hypothetical protein